MAHRLALDKERVAFTPTLINRDLDVRDRILEVWMPGIHSDVGGGYWMDGLGRAEQRRVRRPCGPRLEGARGSGGHR